MPSTAAEKAKVSIDTLRVTNGQLTPRAERMVTEWGQQHRRESEQPAERPEWRPRSFGQYFWSKVLVTVVGSVVTAVVLANILGGDSGEVTIEAEEVTIEQPADPASATEPPPEPASPPAAGDTSTDDSGTATTAEPEVTTTTATESEPTTTTTWVVGPSDPLPPPILDDYRDTVMLDDCSGDPGSDQWCFFGGHATSYVAWRLNTVNFADPKRFDNHYRITDQITADTGLGFWGHARDWDRAARTLGFAVDETPAAGSVAQWERIEGVIEYGFVAYVEAVHHDRSITLSYGNKNRRAVLAVKGTWTVEPAARCSETDCDLDLGWPHSFIHIKDL